MRLPTWAEKELKGIVGSDYDKLCSSFDEENTKYIRVNTLTTKENKLKSILEAKGFVLEKVIENSFRILEAPFSVGGTTEHLQGLYFVQDYSSMLPVIELDPKPGEIVLDIAAAPGGKTTHIAELMKNKGVIIALDINSTKIRALKSNLQRMRVKNTIVIRTNARFFDYKGKIDKILLDAPCTGSGVLRKDKNRASSLSEEDTMKFVRTQKQLVEKAYSLLKKNGEMVYATCSFFRQENEDIIKFAEEAGFHQAGRNNHLFTHKDDSQCFFYSRLVK